MKKTLTLGLCLSAALLHSSMCGAQTVTPRIIIQEEELELRTDLTLLDDTAGTVTLTQEDRTIAVKIDGEDFSVFHTDPKFPKPFFAPVRGPGGTVMTRPIDGLDAKPEDKLDHVHHKGIFLAVDEINGNQHWAETSKIANVSTEIIQEKGNPGVIDVVNQWLDKDGERVAVTESTRIKIYANRLVTYDITFSAGEDMVEFEDTKEGMFGFRMIDSMRESVGGRVVNAEGLKGTAECWGKTSAWVDYVGEVDGKTFGVTIMDHPLNFRPSRYHVRDYGLFSVSPFGEKSYTNGDQPADPAIIPAGGTLRLRYGMYIHAGDTEAADVDGVYRDYLAGDVPQAGNKAASTDADSSAVIQSIDKLIEDSYEQAGEELEPSNEESAVFVDDCDCDPPRRHRRFRRCRGC
ncbi:MAG: PmoA family protein [Planctomycetaceae bacterium]